MPELSSILDTRLLQPVHANKNQVFTDANVPTLMLNLRFPGMIHRDQSILKFCECVLYAR